MPTIESPVSSLAEIIQLIPGYDPVATAGDCWFDDEAAQLALDFFPECLTHVKGELGGQPFHLEPWQQAIIANLFGWYREDDSGQTIRRYRRCLVFVPRKNGKTPLGAGIVLYVLVCDHEPGAEIYSLAVDRDQAALVYEHARGMTLQEPALRERLKVFGGRGGRGNRSITYEAEGSSYVVLSSDADTKHGKNAHLVISDEVHAHKNRDLIDVMETSTSARRQPLIIHFTTSDYERESICNEIEDYAIKVRDNGGDPEKPGYDAYFLPAIYGATREDDWTDEATWYKANPNLGISKKIEYMREQCRIAQENPAFENVFKRLDLNIRTEQSVRVIPMDEWDACDGAVDEAALEGVACHGGLDLATVNDLAALLWVFPQADGVFDVVARFWCPKENAIKRERQHGVPYLAWAKQGYLVLTEGNRIDYNYIRQAVNEDAKRFKVVDIGIDPYNASHIEQQLREEDGLPMVEYRQGILSMNEPTKMLLRLLKGTELRHGGNPVLRWMASNLSAKTDAAGNIKPDKEKSAEKIDGIVALIMALGRSLLGEKPKKSVYGNRGIITI